MKRNSAKLKAITPDTTIYARPEGWHFHLDRNCEMLSGGDFERYGYIQLKASEIKERKLNPCVCCYKQGFKVFM